MTAHRVDIRPTADGPSVACTCGQWPEPVGGLANRRVTYPSTEKARQAHGRHVAEVGA